MKKPNVLFILTDDQRFDTIHALGNGQIQTPNLDTLAAAGTAFTNAHIPSGTVPAVCMPSRAMLNTGKTLFHLYRDGESIPPGQTTMPETFRGGSYETYGTGKWHNGHDSYARSFSRGDEIFFGGMWDHWNVPVCDFDPAGKYEGRIPACTGAFYSNHVSLNRADHVNSGVHSTDLFASKAQDFLEQWNGEKPFYLYLSFMAPHDPRTMPEKFRTMYKGGDIELPPNFAGQHFDFGIYDMRDEILETYPRSAEKIRQHIADYYAMISHVDERIGCLLDTLKRKGVYEDTIIVFSSDNGLAVGQHGLMGKQNCYEHSVRVPLILAGPGIDAGKRCDQPVYLLDIFPTLCTLTGLPCPPGCEGKDFSPALQGKTGGPVRDSIYMAYADKVRAVKKDGWKLIEYHCNTPRTAGMERKMVREDYVQLFYLPEDPYECVNLADRKENRRIIAGLRELMTQYRDEWDELEHPCGRAFWGHSSR
jgi:arylsulfatase A-like enzyme